MDHCPIQDRVDGPISAASGRSAMPASDPPRRSLSARRLAEHVLGWDTARYFTSSNEAEPSKFADSYHALVARRAAREPSAYITGRQEFWDLSFEVSPAVLIPRPETELIVETALDRLGSDRGAPWRSPTPGPAADAWPSRWRASSCRRRSWRRTFPKPRW